MEEKNKWRECREIDFPTLLKRTREELGLTQSEFGRGFGVGLTTVSMWENGKRKVGKDVVEFLVSKELDRAREEVLLELLEKKTNYNIKEVGHGYKVTQEYVLVSDIEKELSKLSNK